MTWTLGEDALLTLVSSAALLGALAGLVLGFGWGCLVTRRAVLRPLRAVARAYRELWRDIVHLCATGTLRPGR